jgi:Zn/Cd-binding protein ZinT
MVSNEDLLTMSDEELTKEIAEHQKRTALLFQTMANRIFKKTKGEGFMKDENVKDQDMVDFAGKIAFFEAIVSVTTQDAQIGVKLKAPHDIASKDCAAYTSYIRSQVQSRKSDPIFKLILDGEPSPRKSPTKKVPPTAPPF